MKVLRAVISICALMVSLSACGERPESADAAVAVTCAPPPENVDAALAAKIDAVVDGAVARGFAGGVAVIRDGAVVYDRVTGNASLAQDIPVTDTTLFHVASITKYFTAALVLRAVEEGKLTLDGAIGDEAQAEHFAARGTTIADLLAHRSGLGSSYLAEAESDRDAALAKIDAVEIDAEKIGGFRYSNDGYDVLGILLEKAYGRPYEDLLREKIFAPACLDHASHWALVDVTDPHIVSQPLRALDADLRKRNYGMMSSAGLLIAAKDLAQYEFALVGGKILSPASLAELQAPRGDTSIGKATYGAFLADVDGVGRRISARGSEDWGDNAILNHYLDKDVIVAVVTSRGPAEDSGAPLFRNEVSEAVEQILFAD